MPSESTSGAPTARGFLRQKDAARYIGVSVRYFRDHVDVRPLELPGTGTRRIMIYRPADLDAWVERVSKTTSRVA